MRSTSETSISLESRLAHPAAPAAPDRAGARSSAVVDGYGDFLNALKRVPVRHRAVTFDVLGDFTCGEARFEIPRLRLVGPEAAYDRIRLGLFAGIHGDEPAGCTALLELATALAEEPRLISGYELSIYPVVNPAGLARGTRENASGKDLNREFWRGSNHAEIRLFEAELLANPFDGIITLHADDTCEGVYGYAHGRTLNEALLEPALRAAEKFLPRDRRATIDGFAAADGLIRECFVGVLSAPPAQTPRPFDVIFETPAHAPFGLQVAASLAALKAIIAAYPAFIAYGQDL
jgi:hypothetical protein